jgi:flagellar motor component MotA
MDTATIHKNADRVASIFNALAMFVLVIGVIAAVLVLVGGIMNEDSTSILQGIAAALVILVYTAITWAGVQLAALVAGYIRVRTTTGIVDR